MGSTLQQNSRAYKAKMVSPGRAQTFKCQLKHEAQNPSSKPHLNPLYQSPGRAIYRHKVTSSEDFQKSVDGNGTAKDDELVKYMSKIPGYLQQMDNGNNIQGRALNFGVLDFTRLEKWKYNERMPGRCHSKLPLSSANSFNSTRRKPRLPTNVPQTAHMSPYGLHVDSSHEQELSEGAQTGRGIIMKIQKFPHAPCDRADHDEKGVHRKVRTSVGSSSEIDTQRSRWKELDRKPSSKIKALSGDQVTHSKPDCRRAWDGEHNIIVKEKENGDLAHNHHLTEPQNIVLLVPKYSSKLSFSESSQFSESRSSYDRQSVSRSRSHDCFASQELHPRDFVPEVLQSCELPSFEEINADSDVIQVPSPNEMLMIPTTLETKSAEATKSKLEPSVSSELSMDLNAAGQPTVKGRHPSPNRRFSFSLGRISRSFSFKDSSEVPQLSSTYITVKSGPVSSNSSAASGSFNGNNANSSARGRSSPLRRLLDPFLKLKGPHSAEAQPISGKKTFSSPKPNCSNELLQVKNHGSSTNQALLQLSVKNDLPFFKLVVDNSSDILAAAVKNTQKDDLSMSYGFYSVHEIRKKTAGWMSQGSRSKSGGFGYISIGQMKIHNSYASVSNTMDSSNLCLITESVFYDSEPRKEDVQASEILTRKEVAAVVVKTPVEKVSQLEPANKGDECKLKNCTPHSLGSNDNFSSAVVILPGGVHGVPNQGAPSSLIERWRSGGSCDCGGWDIGCKLRVFTDQCMTSKSLMPSMPSGLVNLFNQGSEPESKPIFSVAPFRNGLYSVEFNATISLLEAFTICVAIITTRKFSNILELKSPLEEKLFSEVQTRSDGIKTSSTKQGQVPAQYVTAPPTSPVGRI